MSNVGPLTTTFTAPSSCATATGLYQIWSSDSSSYHYEQGPLATMAACFPSGYGAGVKQQYYSPGLCPSGYTAACSNTEVVSATATETAYTCCPTAVDYTCAANSASGRSYLGCTTAFGDVIAIAGVTAVSGGSSFPTSTTEAAWNGIGANSIAVRFRSGDFSTTDEPVVTAASSTSTAPRWTTSCPIEASHMPSSAPAASGLSTPGIAGIGAGSAAGALLLAGFFSFFLCARRRKQRALKSQLRPPPPPPIPRNRNASRPASHPPPPPPPKDMRAWIASPSPTPSEPKDNHLFLPLKQPSRPREVARLPLDGDGCGPYELPCCWAGEKAAERPHELYGDTEGSRGTENYHGDEKRKKNHYDHQQQQKQQQQQRRNLVSPPPAPSFKSSSDCSTITTSSSTFLLAKSSSPRDEPLRSNPASPPAHYHLDGAPGPFWPSPPPPSYGAQPAELGHDCSPRAGLSDRKMTATTTGGLGRPRSGSGSRALTPEERRGRRTGWGTSWAPAELDASSAAGEGRSHEVT